MPYKLLERLFLVRLGPFSDAQIPNHQAGSQRGRSTVQQAGKLIDNIAVCFEEKRKAGLVLVDLTALMAAYHIAWHQRLTLELLQVIVDRQMVRFIVNIIANGSLKRKTSDGECSRMRRLRNSLPQGSYRWCLCCLTSISAISLNQVIPVRICRRLGPTLLQQVLGRAGENLSTDICVIADFLSAWKLKVSATKTTSTAFHPHNREAKHQLAVSVRGNTLPYSYTLIERSSWIVNLPHIKGPCHKILAYNSLLHCLAGSSWHASTPTIRTSALAVAFSATECAAPVWCRSFHSKKLEVALNDATPYHWLFCVPPQPGYCWL